MWSVQMGITKIVSLVSLVQICLTQPSLRVLTTENHSYDDHDDGDDVAELLRCFQNVR